MELNSKNRSWLPIKLRLLAGMNGRGGKSLSAISRKAYQSQFVTDRENKTSSVTNGSTSNFVTDEENQKLSVTKRRKGKYTNEQSVRIALSEILHGRRNTTHLVRLLEEEWELPIGEIRNLVREDRERREAGNPITREEAVEWHAYWRAVKAAKRDGVTVEEAFERIQAARRAMGLAS